MYVHLDWLYVLLVGTGGEVVDRSLVNLGGGGG